jgi:RNA polymerase subunit RPABC4/transcription elongation factor Spt4
VRQYWKEGGVNSPEYINCSNCNEEITPDSEFCPHCGVLFPEASKEQCDTDTGQAATGVCIICRKLVCDECGKQVHGRMLCLDHRKVEVQQDWARVFQSTDINDSELAKVLLESNGFRVLGQNFAPIGYVWDGGGDSALSRSNISKPAKVFVPIPEYLRAEEALKEWKSGEAEARDQEPDTSQ